MRMGNIIKAKRVSATALTLALSGCGGAGGSTSATSAVLVITSPSSSTPTPIPTATTPTQISSTPVSSTPKAFSCTVADTIRHADALDIFAVSGSIRIVAIGSSSTEGVGASSYTKSYPSVLQSDLNSRGLSISYNVVNSGSGGNTLVDIQARLQHDALDLRPQLVILQTGTNDANGMQSDEMVALYKSRLKNVINSLKKTSQVLLINGQHYPNEPAFYEKYIQTTNDVSVELNVPLFDRYGMMKSWIDSKVYKFSDILHSDLLHPNDFTYKCMGDVLAEFTISRTRQ